VYIDAEQRDRHSGVQLGLTAGRAPLTPSIVAEEKVSRDWDELRDIVNSAAQTRLLTDNFGEDIPSAKLFVLKPNESLFTATVPPKTVNLDLPIVIWNEKPPNDVLFGYTLALVVTNPAEVIRDARQRALQARVIEFIHVAAQHGITVSRTLMAELVPMDKATFLSTLNKVASLDCKQLIKIENFVAKHMAMGMSDLQAAIDDVRSPAQPPAEAGTAGKRTRVDFNDAAKVLFESTLAGWRESSASERHEIARQLLAKAKETAAIDTSIWSITTVREAMNNLLKRTNKKARTAQAGGHGVSGSRPKASPCMYPVGQGTFGSRLRGCPLPYDRRFCISA